MLAALATIVWWYAQPGVVQLVALNIMIVCTVNTLLVNGNPLLRYDGYYILSDLRRNAQPVAAIARRAAEIHGRWLLGEPVEDDPLVPTRQRAWLAAYAVASKVYMALVCVAIVWGLVQVLYPLHWKTWRTPSAAWCSAARWSAGDERRATRPQSQSAARSCRRAASPGSPRSAWPRSWRSWPCR